MARAESALNRAHSSAFRTSPTLSNCSCLFASLHPTRRLENVRVLVLFCAGCFEMAAMILDVCVPHLAPSTSFGEELFHELEEEVCLIH